MSVYEDDLSESSRGSPAESSGKATASLILGILSFCLGIFTGIPGLILGILALLDISRSRGRMSGQGIAIAGVVTSGIGTLIIPLVSIGLLLPAVQKVREAANRMQSANNMKLIGLAMHAYHDDHGSFPPAVVYNKEGKPLYSWRILLLPFVEQANLYAQFKLDEPWDSPDNKKLLPLMPKIYAAPGDPWPPTEPYGTRYQVLDGPGAAFESDPKLGLTPMRRSDGKQLFCTRTMRITDFVDGTSNTFLMVEAADPIPWTKPGDVSWQPDQPPPKMGGLFARGFNALYADGSVRFVPNTTSAKTVRLLILRNDGEPLPPDAP